LKSIRRIKFGLLFTWSGMLVSCVIAWVSAFFTAQSVYAAWTPMIASSDFTGIQTDVGVVAAGIISICLIVIGLGMLVKVLSR
jgi:hypothetical protein